MSTVVPVEPLKVSGMEAVKGAVTPRNGAPGGAPVLQSVLSIAELSRRPSRSPDYAAENSALIGVAQEMAASPDGVLQKLAETALALCRAHSAGVSLLEQDGKRFFWPAIAGQWVAHIGGGTPRDHGPCGTILDRNVPLLFSHPERDFSYLAPITPPVEECLLLPFYLHGKAIGTVWVISHEADLRFDSEDLRVMSSLCTFAAAAYQALRSVNAVNKNKQAEEELRESENRFVFMAESMPQKIFTAKSDGSVDYFNPEWTEYTGLTFEQIRDWGWLQFIHPDDKAENVRRWRHSIDTGEFFELEHRFRRNDGEYRWHISRAHALRDAEGKVLMWIGSNTDIDDMKRAKEQVTVLAREAEHRAKNILATVQAMVHLTRSDTVDGLKQAIEGRIRALANVNALFVQSRWSGAALRSLVTQELSPYCQAGETRAVIEGPNLMLEPNTAQAIAVALHELATNAAKYGALSVPAGKVHVEWSHAADGQLVLRWTETDGPPVTPPARQGFGTRVIESVIHGQLMGQIRFDWQAKGLACEIAVPA